VRNLFVLYGTEELLTTFQDYFFENEIPFYLEEVPLATRGRMYLQHEGTPRQLADK
jgi:hypothetical protein